LKNFLINFLRISSLIIKTKKLEIDSISYLILCQDSITIINADLWEYDKNYSRLGTHFYIESAISEELEFTGEHYIIEDLIIYSD